MIQFSATDTKTEEPRWGKGHARVNRYRTEGPYSHFLVTGLLGGDTSSRGAESVLEKGQTFSTEAKRVRKKGRCSGTQVVPTTHPRGGSGRGTERGRVLPADWVVGTDPSGPRRDLDPPVGDPGSTSEEGSPVHQVARLKTPGPAAHLLPHTFPITLKPTLR